MKCVLIGIALLLAVTSSLAAEQKIYRILPVGDSITEGGGTFSNYRPLLCEKLLVVGYLVEFVGSRISESRFGPLRHEGHGGKNAEFLAGAVEEYFRKNGADIMLIHSGHNHTNTEMPVAGIVAATEKMIRTARAANPKIVVLVAQVIPSGKLPKYEYIPELNVELGKLAARLNSPSSPVRAVNMFDGFDWPTDTIADHVHPNVSGAEKMTAKWFAALTNVMERPPQTIQPRLLNYKSASGSELKLHIFAPTNSANKARPTILFFFGGGWTSGTPIQFYPECEHFAAKGFVAISADYRIASVNHTTPFESVADGKSAVRWIRERAAKLQIDPHKIVAAGASAGGQVAAAAGLVSGLDEPGENSSVSSRPDALVLWYPVIDNGPDGYGPPEMKARFREISPLHNVSSNAPPAMIFLGTKDQHVPVKTVDLFKSRVNEAGVRCDLKLFPDAGHPIYEWRKGKSPLRFEALAAADKFLGDLEFLSNQPE